MRTIPFEEMDNIEKWQHPYESQELLAAGTHFLYELVRERFPNAPFLERITRLGDRKIFVDQEYVAKGMRVPDERANWLITEMHKIGTIGFSLWHLRPSFATPGFDDEIQDLARVTKDDSDEENERLLRGVSFLMYSASILARNGFEIEFIKRGDQKRPDFFARRDGNTFACEATTRRPKKLRASTVKEFWFHANKAVEKKLPQLRHPEFKSCVLLLDCSPVFDLMFSEGLVAAGTLHVMNPPGQSGPPPRSVPLLRYDDTEFAAGLKKLTEIVAGSNVHTIMYWKFTTEVLGEIHRRHLKHRVLGTIGPGYNFWGYFDNAIVFPGPDVKVVWDDDLDTAGVARR